MKDASYSYLLLLKDVNSYLHSYRGRFWFASALRFSTDITYLFTSYALAEAISSLSQFTPGQPPARFWKFLAAWAGTYVFVHLGRQIAKFICYNTAERVNVDSQLASLRHLSQVDIAWHEKENTGNKLKRIHNGGEGLEKIIRMWIDHILEISVNFIGMITIVAFVDLSVAFIMSIFLVTYIAIAWPLSRRAAAASRVVNQFEEDFSGLSFEVLNNIRSVKVMDIFSPLFTILKKQGQDITASVRKRILRFRSAASIQNMWAHAFRVVATIVIAFGIVNGHYELGFLIVFNFYFTNLRTSVEELSNISQEIVISHNHIARMRDIMNEPITIDSRADKLEFPKNWSKISFKNVSFAYGNNKVLRDISFEIRKGERIGVVGLSGAGKSTLFKLLLKEYENFTGEILVDGVSVRDIRKDSYFSHVAVVLQDTEVFNFSLKDNITIANTRARNVKKLLATALETAHVSDFMRKLPDGIETMIGEKGVRLSGGEKQRVGIARAIYKEPDLLLLDEATSHLDLESEEKIKDSLHHFFQNVTALVIAHRLTTIQEMDKILLIESGQILESGTFEELMKERGRFFELWNKQRL